MLNVEPSNLVFLKTYNTEFEQIIIIFMDQNSRFLEIEDDTIFELTNATLLTSMLRSNLCDYSDDVYTLL